MQRNWLGFGAGLVAAIAVMAAVQKVNSWFFPLPESLDPNDIEAMTAYLQELPLLALLGLEASCALGALAGGGVLGRITVSHVARFAFGLGAILTAFNVATVLWIPHPLWLAVLTTITFIPLTMEGARFATRWAERPTSPA